MNRIILFTFICLVVVHTGVHSTHALNASSAKEIDYQVCIKKAEEKRIKRMTPAIKAYSYTSQKITNETKTKLDAIIWRTDSTYTTESKIILDEQIAKTGEATKKINKVRKEADTTLKAEKALCDFVNNKTLLSEKKK